MYKLAIGCHHGTITSRDGETREFDTYKEAYDSYIESKKFWRSIGYVVWYAKIIKPDGTEEHLESNTCWY